MIVGFMRNFNKPNDMAELTAKMAKYYGIDIIYFRPKDVNIETHTVTGKFLINDQWVSKKVEIPKVIDISPYCFKRKNRIITNYLQNNCYLTYTNKNRITKEKLQEFMKNDSLLSQYVIPTTRYESFKDLEQQLKKYGTIVLKPIRSERGKGIYIIRKKGRKYLVGHNKEVYIFSKRKITKLFKKEITKKYIIQKYISSRALNGDPFDCRIHFEKNGQGKWSIAKIYVRIGIGQTVISNMNQGGGMADPKVFLKANFPDKWKEIYQKLLDLGEIFPYKFESWRKTDIMSLGIDVGVEPNGDIYIFEANGAPATANLKGEVVNLRTQYYNYLIKTKLNK